MRLPTTAVLLPFRFLFICMSPSARRRALGSTLRATVAAPFLSRRSSLVASPPSPPSSLPCLRRPTTRLRRVDLLWVRGYLSAPSSPAASVFDAIRARLCRTRIIFRSAVQHSPWLSHPPAPVPKGIRVLSWCTARFGSALARRHLRPFAALIQLAVFSLSYGWLLAGNSRRRWGGGPNVSRSCCKASTTSSATSR